MGGTSLLPDHFTTDLVTFSYGFIITISLVVSLLAWRLAVRERREYGETAAYALARALMWAFLTTGMYFIWWGTWRVLDGLGLPFDTYSWMASSPFLSMITLSGAGAGLMCIRAFTASQRGWECALIWAAIATVMGVLLAVVA